MPSTWQDPPEARGLAIPSVTRVVKLLLIANIAVFVLQEVVLAGWFDGAYLFLKETFALDPAQWKRVLVPVWQLVTYGFLHGDAGHILGNMLFLYVLGTMLEEEIGGRRFLAFYLISIALAGACQLVLGLALGQEAPIVGASGGVLAIVCAMATLRPATRIIFIIVPLTLKTLALIYVGLNLFTTVMQLKGGTSNTATFAHLSGALFGFLAARQGWIWRDPVSDFEVLKERLSEQRAASDDERLDELLAKINREGIHALSGRERAFLRRVSQRK